MYRHRSNLTDEPSLDHWPNEYSICSLGWRITVTGVSCVYLLDYIIIIEIYYEWEMNKTKTKKHPLYILHRHFFLLSLSLSWLLALIYSIAATVYTVGVCVLFFLFFCSFLLFFNLFISCLSKIFTRNRHSPSTFSRKSYIDLQGTRPDILFRYRNPLSLSLSLL